MNRHLIFVLAAAILLGWKPLAFGQQTTGMTLEQSIEYALANNTGIKNAYLNIADAEQQINERKATGIPQINGSVAYQRYLQLPVQPLPNALVDFIRLLNPNGEVETEGSFFLKNNFNAGLNLETMIFEGSYFVALRAARAYRNFVQQQLLVEKREVRNQVTGAFLPVLLLKTNLEIIDKNIGNLEKLLAETKELYKEGFVEQLDIDRQELSLLNLQTERENLLRQKENAILALKFAMGHPIDGPLEVIGELEDMTMEVDDQQLVSDINYGNRPETGLSDLNIQLNELNLKLNKSYYLPSVRGNGAYTYTFQGNTFKEGFWAPSAYVGLNVNIPIFDGFDKKAKIQRVRIDIEEASNQKIEIKRGIELEIQTARTSYINAREKLSNQRKNLDLAQRIYDTTQIKYREGVGSSLEVTQAEQSLYTSQSNYLNALYDVIKAKSDLQLALGNI